MYRYLGEELNYKTPSDWYSINHMAFEKYFGIGLLQKYNDSPADVVMEVMRDHVCSNLHLEAIFRSILFLAFSVLK